MLPFVLLGCVWWRRGRVRGKTSCAVCPFFTLSLVLGLMTIWFQYNRVLGDTQSTAGFLWRLAAAGWVPWFYLYKALLPLNLSVIYPKWDVDASPGFPICRESCWWVACTFLVEAQELGAALAVWAGVLCGDAFPGVGILRSGVLSSTLWWPITGNTIRLSAPLPWRWPRASDLPANWVNVAGVLGRWLARLC